MKKIKYLIASLSLLLISMPVMAADCGKKETSACKTIVACMDNKIPNTVHIVIVAIQIVVPILLVIFGMIDLVKAVVAGKEDEIKKAQSVLIRRLITGVLVFFVVAVVRLLISFTGDFSQGMTDCMNVFINGVGKK